MADPSVRAGSAIGWDSGTSSTWSVPAPVGAAAGDLMARVVVTDSPHEIVSATGWTQVDVTLTDGSADSSMSAFLRVATGSEPATHDVVFAGSELGSAVTLIIDDADAGTPQDAAAVGTVGTGSSRTAGPITTVTAGALVLGMFGTDPSSELTMTWDSPAEEVIAYNRSGSAHISIGALTQAVPGAVSVTGTWSTADNATQLAVAIRPGSGGPPPDPVGAPTRTLLGVGR